MHHCTCYLCVAVRINNIPNLLSSMDWVINWISKNFFFPLLNDSFSIMAYKNEPMSMNVPWRRPACALCSSQWLLKHCQICATTTSESTSSFSSATGSNFFLSFQRFITVMICKNYKILLVITSQQFFGWQWMALITWRELCLYFPKREIHCHYKAKLHVF